MIGNPQDGEGLAICNAPGRASRGAPAEQTFDRLPKRQLRLTPDHVARLPVIPDPGNPNYPGIRPATDADYDAEVERIISTAPEGEFWIFAYGSLIWNPATEFEAERLATARGWHRNFCLL